MLLHPALRASLAVLGLLGGLFSTWKHITVTDFPVDMIIYRQGVQAYLDGRSMYAEPMMAGDLALPFIYPPFGALVMAPLNLLGLSDDAAGNLLIALSNGLVLLCLYLVFRAVCGRADIWWAVLPLWAVALNFEPVDLNNGFAQINIVVMALVVLDLVPRKRYLPQGWLIGIAAAIKITPLAMLLYFLVRKEIKPIVAAGVSALAATALAAAFRWQAFVEFFSSKLLEMGKGADFGVSTDYQSNSSIKGVIQRLYTSREAMEAAGTLTNIAWLVLALGTIAAGAWLMRYLIAHQLEVEAWLTGAMVMLLISPVSWSHHWVWLALIIPVFAYRALTWRSFPAGALCAVLAAWAGMLLTVPPKWWFGDIIDVQTMAMYQKFLVNDFVWLALLAAPLLWAAHRARLSPSFTSH
ncbi:membrane protein [Corynebacterium phocae]|uniref:Membrane protein n=1 Tax=Corynebacterium phocae TaxID=161895 RepID=A0A1L7D6J7_9CORY|nr:membrane protein [Corynebacterium phocae]